ncbi:MAG TPA: DNA replication and repair protein RecF [Candidatus Dormibacteraeota bacterium]|nr:DNA replication and repair protein RecF [Candidatus Dormibacteraeota bacterium]
MITDIHLQNFRSYKDSSFDISNGVNIIIGQNGSGKTNLLESIMIITSGSSYRSKDHNLVLIGSEWARVEVHTPDQTRVLKIIKDQSDSLVKNFIINSKPITRLKLEQKLPIVLFEPNHLQLFTGSPQARRDYLDDILEQTKPGYGRLISKYKRLVTQRNNLLKKPPIDKHSIFAWNVQLSELGGKINKQRQELVDAINKKITDIYRSVSNNKENIKLKYVSEFELNNYETKLLKALENFSQDQLRGHTLHGPHRDDFKIYLNNYEFSAVASRGEIRTTLLALKLIEAKIIEDYTNKKPILLLDDVFGELDQQRRKLLTNKINNYQSFITTTDADVVNKHFDKTANIIVTQ